LSQTILKDRNVNRLTDVNVSINIGTRLPRSVRLAALPAAVIAIVPEYRSYRYFVKDDQICIVDPHSYEIVEIIPASGQVATRERGGGSTLGLGALTEGSDVPRDVKVRTFPESVIRKVPKLQGYGYVTAENRVAIVDRQGGKVRLVIDQHR
jgi:hypothetical protein